MFAVRKPKHTTGRILLILIAEDDFTNYRYLEYVLRKTGANIVHCGNGAEVLKKFEEGLHPDLILMDISMPVMDGREVTAILREQHYTGPVLALTAFTSPEERKRCLEAGCNDFITKPVDSYSLTSILADHIENLG